MIPDLYRFSLNLLICTISMHLYKPIWLGSYHFIFPSSANSTFSHWNAGIYILLWFCIEGTFKNYVDHFLVYFDHLPTYSLTFAWLPTWHMDTNPSCYVFISDCTSEIVQTFCIVEMLKLGWVFQMNFPSKKKINKR